MDVRSEVIKAIHPKGDCVNKSSFIKSTYICLIVGLLALSGCSKLDANKLKSDKTVEMTGKIKIDGSSTVYPVTEAIAEEFNKEHRKVRITVGVSGTGGGFKKFLRSETDISNASRHIKGKEKAEAEKNNIHYMEVPVAYDGISLVINKKNTFAKQLTMAQLKQIWARDSKIMTWKDINPSWPDKKIKLYGPGPDSGTFDFFVETVLGKKAAPRSDYVASEDDNVIVRGVAGDRYALGYFGYAYFQENKTVISALALKEEANEAVLPSLSSIKSGDYPLSRPIFIYVSKKAASRPEVKSFVRFYLSQASGIVGETGYIPLSQQEYKKQIDLFNKWSKGKLLGSL